MEPNQFNIKKLWMVGGSALLFLIIWVYVSSPLVVTVTGTGEVSVPATNATVSFTLSTINPSIDGAVNFVEGKADSIRRYLESNGVNAIDIAQSQVTEVPAALVTSGGTGYQATISMAAKTKRVSDISKLVSGLYANGALVVAQPVLSVENQDKLEQQAFNSALSDAKKQAAKIGLSNLKFIRKVVLINQATSPSTSTATTKAGAAEGANTTASTNGVFKIVKAVSVSYKMW